VSTNPFLSRFERYGSGGPSQALGQIDRYGFTAERAVERASSRPLTTAVDGFAGAIGSAMAKRFPSLRESQVRAELVAGGFYHLSPRTFIGYRVICFVSIPVVWLWIVTRTHPPLAITILGLAFAITAGWVGPVVVVRNRARRRFEAIDHELPELIDLLVVTVEAGLGFSGSLQTAAQRLEGPLGDELRLTLQEQSMGLSVNDALKNMLARSDTPAMRSFVRSILQGETLGVSIGQIMRNLAKEMRTRRRQHAEERAQKAPIKLLFPLIFLIFPAMFVILLGPAAPTFTQSVGGK